MRQPNSRGPGRPSTRTIRSLVAIGAKVSILGIDLSLDVACRAVNGVCDNPAIHTGLAALEAPICTSTLRKRVAALMGGGVRWRQLRSAEHKAQWIEVVHRVCPHFASSILTLVEATVLSIHGHSAPPQLFEVAVKPEPEDLDWRLEGLGFLELSTLSLPSLEELEAVSTAESKGLEVGFEEVLGEWDDEFIKSIIEAPDFLTM